MQTELAKRAAEFFASTPFKPSVSIIERQFRPGYKAAADALEELQAAGLVSAVKPDGTRDYLGALPAGRAAFAALAEKLGAKMEPAARWWESLTSENQYRYAQKAGVRWVPWDDMEAAEKNAIRLAYRRARATFEELGRQFARLGVAA